MEATPTIDQLETELLAIEAAIARGRARQLELLRALDAAAVAALDGSRTFAEWTAARLDAAPETARELTRAAADLEAAPGPAGELAAGTMSLDRAAATARLVAVGADEATVETSRGLDIAGVRRLASRHRRRSRREERRTFNDRYLFFQPSLDESAWRLSGILPGYGGAAVAAALADRADGFPTPGPDEPRSTRPQRNADALVAMALDSAAVPESETAAPLVTVFVDADLAARSGGEAGAEIAAGPRIGPETLEQLLCEGRLEVTLAGAEPLAVGHTSRAVPPRLRRFVLHRDGGCVADGCLSRYRLQAHHVIPASRGGRTDPDNLTTLCWYHHHVVVHGQQRRIDPASRPGRIRFLRPASERGPPIAA